MTMPLRSGIHRLLENEADRLIRESLAGITSHSAKADILTSWKEKDRRRREVYASTGTVDPQVRRGMYHRVANMRRPELNSRDGVAPPRTYTSSLGAFVAEHGAPDGGGY